MNEIMNPTQNLFRNKPSIIADELRNDILVGRVNGGDQLKQEEIAKHFNSSLIPVREALKQLEAEGLVTIYPNRGAIVSELSTDEVKEIFEIRILLETGIIGWSIPKMTEHDIEKLEDLLNKVDAETDSSKWSALNWQFHAALYAPACKPKLMSIIKTLNANVDRYMRLALTVINYQSKSQSEHRKLLNACKQKDIDSAKNILHLHIKDGGEILSVYLLKMNESK